MGWGKKLPNPFPVILGQKKEYQAATKVGGNRARPYNGPAIKNKTFFTAFLKRKENKFLSQTYMLRFI